jgi:hypothetical protein
MSELAELQKQKDLEKLARLEKKYGMHIEPTAWREDKEAS